MNKVFLIILLAILFLLPSIALADSTDGEYEPGEDGTMYTQVFNNAGSPVADAVVVCYIRNNAGAIVITGTMTYQAGSNGIYYLDFVAPDTKGTYSCDVISTNYGLYGSTDMQIRGIPTWWEENLMIVALAIILTGMTIGGYALHKGDLTIIGGVCFVILGGYAFLQSDTGISPMGTASILLGLIVMLAGAMMWRHRSQEKLDEEIYYDDDEYNAYQREQAKKAGDQPKSPWKQKHESRQATMKQQSQERKQFRRDMKDDD